MKSSNCHLERSEAESKDLAKERSERFAPLASPAVSLRSAFGRLGMTTLGAGRRAIQQANNGWISHAVLTLVCAAGLSVPAPASGASVVDWLAFQPGDNTHFTLVNDVGASFANAEVQIISGVPGPLSPSAGLLDSAYWTSAPPFADSVTGDGSITTAKVQIAPSNGLAQYRLTITGLNLSGLDFAVGQLFGSGTSGTRLIHISALTAAGDGVPVTFLQTEGWDDGIRFYTEPLTWDSTQNTLEVDPNANGDSGFAFFAVSQSATPVTQLVFDIPNGYNGRAGEAIEFGFASPIPEPGNLLLFGMVTSYSLFRYRGRGRSRNDSGAVSQRPYNQTETLSSGEAALPCGTKSDKILS